MGCGSSKIVNDNGEERKKFLLLGVAGAGKSTFFKQIKTSYADDYTSGERLIAHLHIINQMVRVIKLIVDSYNKQNPQNTKVPSPSLENIQSLSVADLKKDNLLGDYSKIILKAWELKEIKEHLDFMRKSPGIAIVEIHTINYFFDKVKDILSVNYKVTNEDLIFMRKETSGSQSLDFRYLKQNLRLVDVGGQLHERISWFEHFNHLLSSIIFVISLTDYCATNPNGVNKFSESKDVINYLFTVKDLANTPIIILLNKSDLFQNSLNQVPFTYYDSTCDKYDAQNAGFCLDLIKEEIYKINPEAKKRISIYKTNATDTKLVQNVFEKIIDINKMTAQGFIG